MFSYCQKYPRVYLLKNVINLIFYKCVQIIESVKTMNLNIFSFFLLFKNKKASQEHVKCFSYKVEIIQQNAKCVFFFYLFFYHN